MVRQSFRLGIVSFLLVGSAFFLLQTAVNAQAAISIGNFIPGQLDAPIWDSTGTNRLQGSYVAELLVGLSPDALIVTPYRTGIWQGERAGYLLEARVPIDFRPGLTPGQTVYCQLRVWDYGTAYDYDMAVATGAGHGQSAVFPVVTGTPEQPGLFLELKSFQLQPSTYGLIAFTNRIPGVLDAPLFDAQGARLAGPDFVAQLSARIATNAMSYLVPIGDPVPLGSGENAGYFGLDSPTPLALTNMAGGQLAEMQLFVWDRTKGATFEDAARVAALRGASQVLQVKTGGEGNPATPPAPLTGLTSFGVAGDRPGLVRFANKIPGVVERPIEGLAPPVVVQLYAGRTYADMQPVSSPAPVDSSGFWTPAGDGIVTLKDIQAGESVIAEIRAWNGAEADSYEQAVLSTDSGESGPFPVRTGGAGQPPSPPGLVTRLPILIWMHQPRVVRVDFRNRIAGTLDTPVFARDGSRLAGSNFVAQLYARVFEGFQPVGAPAPFGTGELAGYWQPAGETVYTIDVPAGCCADIQVRIWDQSTGTTYETATGEKAVSRTVFYFADNRPETLAALTLNTIGVFWNTPGLGRRIYVTQYTGGEMSWIYDIDQFTPLDGPDWVAQLFVAAADQMAPPPPSGEVDPAKLVAVGPVAPVRQGRWQLPPNTSILLPGFSSNMWGDAVLRVWQSSLGTNYEEAAAKGSLLGTSYTQRFHTGWDSGDEPIEVNLSSSFALRGRRRTISVPPGLSLQGNPYAVGAAQYVESVLPSAPEGTMVYTFKPETQSYGTVLFDFKYWSSGGIVIPFGVGFFVRNPSDQPITLQFEGMEGMHPPLTRPAASPVFYAVSCTETQPCGFAELTGIAPRDGDAVYRLVNGNWDVSHYDQGSWSAFTPQAAPGEAVFVRLVPAAP